MNKKSHPICTNKSKEYHYQTMHRTYTRDKGGKFIPFGWICHNCRKIIQDWEITEFLKNKKEIISWREEINDIVFYNPRNYLES